MKALVTARAWINRLIDPPADPAVAAALQAETERAPGLWLLGKSGAGKSSLIQRLTGDTHAEIGNGFAPCTRHLRRYDHPADLPVMRFYDTRGLGEAGYDPAEDLATLRQATHAILILIRVDDPAQNPVLHALGALKAQPLPMLLVHTALHTVPDDAERQRAIRYARDQVAHAVGRDVPEVAIDFPPLDDAGHAADIGLPELRTAIIARVPELAEVLIGTQSGNRETAAFLANRSRILAYASAAGGVDLLPGVGLIAVPGIQGKLLHELAVQYGVPWNRRAAQEFVAAMGAGFLTRYAVGLLGRQLTRLIPVYGQSVGAATAAALSLGSTYALGRAACLYLYRRLHNEPINTADLRAAFEAALSEQRQRGGKSS